MQLCLLGWGQLAREETSKASTSCHLLPPVDNVPSPIPEARGERMRLGLLDPTWFSAESKPRLRESGLG